MRDLIIPKEFPDRFRAIDRFFEDNPQYLQKMVYIQAGVISRIHIEAYKALNKEIDSLVEQINWKYGTHGWKPIILLRMNLSHLTLLALRSMSDFCIVSSLHDGMNLVAKEYVASRSDENGVLILSHFTGSARELTDAILGKSLCHRPFCGSHQKSDGNAGRRKKETDAPDEENSPGKQYL